MIQLEVGKKYWHVVMFPAAIAVEVTSVKRYWFLQKVTLRPLHSHDGEPYTVWSTSAGFSQNEFVEN